MRVPRVWRDPRAFLAGQLSTSLLYAKGDAGRMDQMRRYADAPETLSPRARHRIERWLDRHAKELARVQMAMLALCDEVGDG
jgi:hypothetical protein